MVSMQVDLVSVSWAKQAWIVALGQDYIRLAYYVFGFHKELFSIIDASLVNRWLAIWNCETYIFTMLPR